MFTDLNNFMIPLRCNLIFIYERLLWCFMSAFGVKNSVSFILVPMSRFVFCEQWNARDNSESTLLWWCFAVERLLTQRATALSWCFNNSAKIMFFIFHCFLFCVCFQLFLFTKTERAPLTVNPTILRKCRRKHCINTASYSWEKPALDVLCRLQTTQWKLLLNEGSLKYFV